MLTDKELEERAEEYSHKVWCVDEICELEEEEINSLKDCEKDFKAGYKSAKEEIEKLNEQVKLLENTVAFYADRNNWQLVPFTGEVKEVIVMSDLGCKIYNGENDFRDYELSSGGRRAREALQKLEEVREKK